MDVTGYLGSTTRVGKEIFTFWWVFEFKFSAQLFSMLFHCVNIFRSWTCLDLVFGMSGILWANRRDLSLSLPSSLHPFYTHCYIFLTIMGGNRMAPGMAACIAVEAISILEKLHMKG